MTETRHEITAKQFCTFIFSTQIGIGLLTIPEVLAKKTGHDGWISLLIAGVLCILAFYIMVLYLQRFQNKSIYEINPVLYGKHAGWILNWLIVLYLVFAAAIGIRFFEEVIKTMALRHTPSIVITVFIMIPTIYMSLYGLKVICRFSGLILLIAAAVVTFLLMNFNQINLLFLLPVGEAGVEKIFPGVFDAFFVFIGFELVIIVYPYIKDKENTMKWGMVACLLSIIVTTIVTAFITAFFGEIMLKLLTLPMFNLSRCYKSRIFERVDLFFTLLWFPAMAISLRAYFFVGYESICRLMNIKKTSLALAVYSIVLIAASRLPKNSVQANETANLISISVIVLIGFVLTSFLLSIILKRKG